jgi:hypothetical protein
MLPFLMEVARALTESRNVVIVDQVSSDSRLMSSLQGRHSLIEGSQESLSLATLRQLWTEGDSMKALLFVTLFSMGLSAQTFQGSLRGRIVDPSDAAISGAKITVVEEGTKVSRTTVSNDEGEYVFTSLKPATYTLNTEVAGFKTIERPGVVVATQAAVAVDVKLQLGQVAEQVTVAAESPVLQTADASVGQVIDSQKITDLPALGRNPFFQAKLSQSVVFVANPKMGRMQDQNANTAVSIAGGPLRANNTLLDGVSITDSNNRAVILPSPEAVAELKLQTATYDAEAGRTGGGTFNTVLRSGTNDLHGSAVGHIRQQDWIANSFFANRAGSPVPNQPFKDWAASLGGPIIIPKLYDGRNKTFFFVTTESYRQLDAATSASSVPTALERTGDFSQSFAKTGTLQTIYDPLSTTASGTRTPFVGNVIPANELNPIGVKLASYYPQPNATTPYYGAPNYNFTGNFPNRGDQSTWKGDHQFTPWFRASGSYIHQKTGETSSPLTFGNIASPGQSLLFRRIDATQANATLTPDATTVISVRWGFNRFFSTSGPTTSAGFDLASLGLPQSLASVTPNPAFPAITMGTLTSFGGGTTSRDVYYSRTASASISKFLGRHSLKAGFDFRTLHDAGTPSAGPTGLGFTDVFTRPNPASATTGKGADLATLLLGYPTSGSQSLVTNFDDFVRYYGVFVQDDFRVTPKLTLNFGFRLEHETGLQEEQNKLLIGFDPTAPSGLPGISGAVRYAGVNGNPTQTGSPLTLKPSPRFGFAYSPDSKTVVRGGFGVSWAPIFFNFQNAVGYSQTTSIVSSTDNNFTPAATLTNPYPNGILQPTGNSLPGLAGVGQAITVPATSTASAGYVEQYSLEVQRQTPGGLVFTVGALGSHSLHLLENGLNIDQLNPANFATAAAQVQANPKGVTNPFYNNGGVGTLGTATVSPIQLLLPYPQYTSVALSNADNGTARYYSFYIRGEHRFSHGLSLLASYTWSRSVDNLIGQSSAGTSQITVPSGAQNAYNLNAERGLSTQDVPNRFTTALTYELPLGRGRQYLHGNRVVDFIVGGWSVNAVNIIQTGFPLAITQPNNNSTIGASSQRPNATGVSPATSGSVDDRINGWLNPAAFTQTPQFAFGNVSRFLNVRGPGLFNWDASIFKTFAIKEHIKAQFRAEALNATNTPYFGNPNATLTNSSFGLITTQINYPRLINLGVRVTF